MDDGPASLFVQFDSHQWDAFFHLAKARVCPLHPKWDSLLSVLENVGVYSGDQFEDLEEASWADITSQLGSCGQVVVTDIRKCLHLQKASILKRKADPVEAVEDRQVRRRSIEPKKKTQLEAGAGMPDFLISLGRRCTIIFWEAVTKPIDIEDLHHVSGEFADLTHPYYANCRHPKMLRSKMAPAYRIMVTNALEQEKSVPVVERAAITQQALEHFDLLLASRWKTSQHKNPGAAAAARLRLTPPPDFAGPAAGHPVLCDSHSRTSVL